MNTKMEDWASICSESCGLMMLWTGRCSVSNSLIRCYGRGFQHWPEAKVEQLSERCCGGSVDSTIPGIRTCPVTPTQLGF